jgi:hypothetical protein
MFIVAIYYSVVQHPETVTKNLAEILLSLIYICVTFLMVFFTILTTACDTSDPTIALERQFNY